MTAWPPCSWGALASNLYGVPRATNDADVVIQFGSLDLQAFCKSLGSGCAVDPQMMTEGFTGTVRNVITFVPTGFPVEMFRLGEDPHDRERFARRRQQQFPEAPNAAWVTTAEDVVIQKLRWPAARISTRS